MIAIGVAALVLLAPRTVAGSEPPADAAGPPAAAPSAAHAVGPTATDAVGSDEAPLPAAPPAPGGRLTRGVFTGKGWIELGPTLLSAPRLPGGRTLLSAGITGALGLRPHRHFGVFTSASTWIGDVQQREGLDEDGNSVIVSAPVPTTAWDVLGVRAFLPIGKRLEPSADLASGLVVEKRPFTGRRVWGGLRASLGLAIWVAPTLSLRFAADYRLHARRDGAVRHFVGGSGTFSIHF